MQRARWIDNDPEALRAMWTQVLAEGPVATTLTEWTVPCLIVIGASDADFLDQARRAATEIPGGELLLLEQADHYRARQRRRGTHRGSAANPAGRLSA